MKVKSAIIYLVMLLTVTACERVAEIDVPHTDPQPVMYAFLSPDESDIRVSITLSQPIFNNTDTGSFKQQSQAWVQITDSKGNKKVIPYNISKQRFILSQTEYPILPGETYTIDVAFDAYSMKGSCTVPQQVIYFDSVYSQYIGQGTWGEDQYRFFMKWKDQAGMPNYYRISLEDYTANPGTDTTSVGAGDKMVSDKDKDGEMMSEKSEYYYYNFQGSKPTVMAFLVNADQAYYEYHKRRLNYFGDDPFSEPFPQFSNVKGGLGVVAAFRKSSMHIPIQ